MSRSVGSRSSASAIEINLPSSMLTSRPSRNCQPSSSSSWDTWRIGSPSRTARTVIAAVFGGWSNGQSSDSSRPAPRYSRPERRFQSVDERHLRRLDPSPSLVGLEPLDPVDLGEASRGDPTAAATRARTRSSAPRPDPGRPRRPTPWTTLPPFWTIDPSSIVGAAASIAGPGLLLELAPRDGLETLARAVRLALRDRPVAHVALREVRPARVREQHLEPAVRAARPAVEQDPGARSFAHRAVDGRSRGRAGRLAVS